MNSSRTDKRLHSWRVYAQWTYALGGREGGSVFDCPGLSSVIVGDRDGRGGGGALSYLYAVFGTAFMFNSTGRRPVSV